MFYPTFEKVEKLATQYKMIPVCCEQYADTETPISVFKKLKTDRNIFLLESVNGTAENSRYSFIGRNPFLILKSTGKSTIVSDNSGKQEKYENKNPLEILKQLCEKYKSPILEEFSGFNGGAVGYFGYDTVRLQENLPNVPKDLLGLPDLCFMLMDEIIAFDHAKQKLIIIINIKVDGSDIKQKYEQAKKRIFQIQQQLALPLQQTQKQPSKAINKLEIESNFTQQEFIDNVEKAKTYIQNGDIFQVVLAQQFKVKTDVDPLQVYRALRVINPSPYMYYLCFDDFHIVGASPERLIRVENGIVENCPIAGARKRGNNDKQDEALIADLIADPKENAEHTMLVDLGRNDIGKVCKFGTVKLKRFKYIQKFSHVIHILSDLEGELRDELTPFDALSAVLPAGTLSGAPKVRAMQIIDELETVKRGPYGGGIGYIGFNGSFDSCITIRTAVFKDKTAYIGAGAGIVYDSIAQNEYQESINKAMSMLKAIEQGGELI